MPLFAKSGKNGNMRLTNTMQKSLAMRSSAASTSLAARDVNGSLDCQSEQCAALRVKHRCVIVETLTLIYVSISSSLRSDDDDDVWTHPNK